MADVNRQTEEMLSPDDAMLSSEPVTKQQLIDAAKDIGEFAIDITPVIGDAKAAKEFPEDMQLAKDLVNEGYTETDFKKMGLGSLYGIATVLGFIPAADLITKPIQKGVKKTVKKPAAFQPEFRQQQIADAKKLFSDSASRRQYLRNVNRPVQKVFHGSPTMGSSLSSDVINQKNKINNTLELFEETYSTTPIINAVAKNNNKSKLDVSKFKDVLLKENFKFPYVISRDENFPEPVVTYATPTVSEIKEDFVVVDLEILDPTVSEGAYATDKVLIPIKDGILNLDELQYTINDYAAKSFENAFADTIGTGTTRADILEAQGFEPFSEFQGAPGLTRDSATGEHFELKEKALSTSRDPLVSLKKGFAAQNLQNVVYADLPPSVQKNMSPEQYLQIQQTTIPENITKTMKLDEDSSLVGAGLPKTHHFESEVAVTRPELLTPQKLDPEKKYVGQITEALRNQKNIGKQDLAGRVATGQKLVNSILKNQKNLETFDFFSYQSPAKAANEYYNYVRETFKDLQSLGMFTEQYGARGTFDNILVDDLAKGVVNFPATKIDKNLNLAIDALPDGEKRQNLIVLRETLTSIGRQKNIPDFMSTQSRGLSKKDIAEKHFTTSSKSKREPIKTQYGYRDLKEIIFLLGDKLNRGGLVMNEGGAVPMKEQMEMFEDGGLMQEGGTVDPVSGNDVPVGSTQEEVRDDIPAQLSEGEFVFPADVVRYYGLEKLMEMRQEAKAGLQRMEAMGQMGNSEEATLPDDIPFDLEDLDIEDEMGDNNEMEMQVGGFVQPQGFTGIQTTQPSQFQNYQPQYVPYQAPVVTAAYQPAQQQAVPTFTGQIPQAQDFLKTPQPGEQDLRKYVNDEGQVRMIPFVNDQPIYPIPQGFYPEAEKPVEEEAAPAPVTTETTRVTDRGGRDTGDTTPGATMSFGGSKDRTGRISGTMTGNISYSGFPGGIPGILGAVGRVTGFTDALQLSEGQTATLSNVSVPEGLSTRDVLGNQSITFNADTFNKLNKADVTSNERKEVEEYLDKIGKLFGNVKKDLNLSYEDAKNIVDLQEAEAAKETRTEAQLSAAQAARERYQAAQAEKQKQDKGNGGGFESSGRAGAEAAARDLGVGMATRGKAKGGVATKKMKRGGLASKK